MLERFSDFLDQHHRVLLTTHENPDGDGVGAMLGLAHYLRFLGKEPRIVVFPHLPENLVWLDTQGWIEALDAEGAHKELAAWPDAWIVVDASEVHRLGPLEALYHASPAVHACLDHHLKDAPKGFDEEFTDPAASASGELVYDLATKRMPLPLPMPMADALYTAVVSDTGNFRHSNSTPKVHHIAAQLIGQGVQSAAVYTNLWCQETPQKLRLFARVMNGLRMLDEGRFAYVAVTKADLAECGATHDDLDGLVEEPRKLRGVEVSGVIYEAPDGRIKLSLRSRERVNVNAVCRLWGGGGHRLASGAKLEGSLKAAVAQVEAAVLEQIHQDLDIRISSQTV